MTGEVHRPTVGVVAAVIGETGGRSRRHSRSFVALVVLAALLLGGCSASVRTSDDSVAVSIDTVVGATTTAAVTPSTVAAPPTSGAPTTVAPAPTTSPPTPPAAPASARERLAVLAIDDRPSPAGVYRREDWPHWSDPDGNGCDARQDALIAWSIVAATVNRAGTCKVVTGSWVSPYDGRITNNPSDVDIDHLVPLENAFVSGGWRWSAAQRRAFANDPAVLVATSASSNRSKGSKPPDEWRPPDRSSWCAYADGWVAIKQRWSLTATTAERDALGQRLDTCTAAGPVWPGRG